MLRQGALDRRPSFSRFRATCASLKRSSASFRAHVPVAEAVGDHRAAADDRLEHGQPGARVDQRVRGREHVAHPVGEAHHAQARIAREALGTCAREGSRCGRKGTARSRPATASAASRRRAGRRRPSRRPTPRSPSVSGQAERARASRASAAPGTRARSAAWPSGRCPGRRSARPRRADSGWVMKCRSMPGWAQKRRPARSVIEE